MFLEIKLEKFGLSPEGLCCLPADPRGPPVPEISAGVLNTQEHSRDTCPPQPWELLLLIPRENLSCQVLV